MKSSVTEFTEKPLSPRDDWNQRIDHILEAIAAIESDVEGLTRAAFMQDELRQRAVLWSFQVIGEAIRALPEDFRDRYPDVQWRAIRGLRNVIVHQCEGVDFEQIWVTITERLPKLREQMLGVREDIAKGGASSP